ncbi:MAG: heat-inducible transcription repressor HrcA [Thermomicrobiales bacterium]|nr:heat-inducible transcription repressor HrcA [Thermomicrobiales bacterium]MCO5222424.1 heat-inducible transcriptional repressor HrcA [Thermomicrobiales bacterium]
MSLDRRKTTHTQIEITERQQQVLRLIVREHVSNGRPVGSKFLAERYSIGYSAATIRNEMAELEAAGFVDHLHTSGGRVPTDAGYRYFVGHLMDDIDLPAGDQIMIRHQFRQAETKLDDWPELAASVLAEIAGNVSVVTSPRADTARIRHLELISLQPQLALLILVTRESTVRQSMVHLPAAVEQVDLRVLAGQLSADLAGRSAQEVRTQVVGSTPLAAAVVEQIIETLRQIDSPDQISIRSKGLQNIVGQPGIEDDDVHAVLQLVQGGAFLNAILPQVESGDRVQVFIGRDELPDQLQRFGVIVATYGVDDNVKGLIGVLGPTRMSYWRTISTVRYMSRLISDLVADLYPAAG